MQQYNVPQFVDVEDKIFGPMTLKQFLTFLGGALIIFVIWLIFDIGFVFWILSVPIFLLTVILSFAQFNGVSVLSSVFPFIGYIFLPKKRVFHREPLIQIPQINTVKIEEQKTVDPKEVQSRLKRLAYVLDQKTEEEQKLTSQINVQEDFLSDETKKQI